MQCDKTTLQRQSLHANCHPRKGGRLCFTWRPFDNGACGILACKHEEQVLLWHLSAFVFFISIVAKQKKQNNDHLFWKSFSSEVTSLLVISLRNASEGITKFFHTPSLLKFCTARPSALWMCILIFLKYVYKCVYLWNFTYQRKPRVMNKLEHENVKTNYSYEM